MDRYDPYREGKICRQHDTPQSVLSTLEDWFDGAKSTMKLFVMREPVSPAKLLKEISKCIATNNQGEKEARALMDLQKWALRQDELARAVQAFHQAKDAMADAVQAAEVGPYDAARLAELV